MCQISSILILNELEITTTIDLEDSTSTQESDTRRNTRGNSIYIAQLPIVRVEQCDADECSRSAAHQYMHSYIRRFVLRFAFEANERREGGCHGYPPDHLPFGDRGWWVSRHCNISSYWETVVMWRLARAEGLEAIGRLL